MCDDQLNSDCPLFAFRIRNRQQAAKYPVKMQDVAQPSTTFKQQKSYGEYTICLLFISCLFFRMVLPTRVNLIVQKHAAGMISTHFD